MSHELFISILVIAFALGAATVGALRNRAPRLGDEKFRNLSIAKLKRDDELREEVAKAITSIGILQHHSHNEQDNQAIVWTCFFIDHDGVPHDIRTGTEEQARAASQELQAMFGIDHVDIQQ